ncbi:UPF0725 protein EMB2204 [Raphanus sativus]|nr:UPF0725 protein EMB2204 [Raphanus sativus]
MSCLQSGRPPPEESDGFDYPGGIPVTYTHHRLMHFDCEGKYPHYAYPQLVKLYAKLGVHRYNLLEGKNLKFCRLKSFNMRINCGASSYYITLDARSGFQKFPFQVLVNERRIGCLDLAVSIARPRVSPRPYLRRHCEPMRLDTVINPLPDWPLAFSDAKRFYMVNESELQNNGWISLYLELALVSHVRDLTDHYLAQLEIVQVAVETLDDVKPPTLDSKDVVIYIAYRDFAKAETGEPCDSKAIVRRVFNESTGGLKFMGKYWSEEKKTLSTETETASGVEVTEKGSMHLSDGRKTEKRCKKKKKRLGVHRLWRLSDPMCHQAFKSRASAPRRQ